MAPDSRPPRPSPCVAGGGGSPRPPRVRRDRGDRCGEPFVPGNGVRPERGPPSRPSRRTHVRVEPGAKPFVDDLLLGRGFVRSRAAPSLRSIESQPSTQGFVSLALSLARSGRLPTTATVGRPSSPDKDGGAAVGRRLLSAPPPSDACASAPTPPGPSPPPPSRPWPSRGVCACGGRAGSGGCLGRCACARPAGGAGASSQGGVGEGGRRGCVSRPRAPRPPRRFPSRRGAAVRVGRGGEGRRLAFFPTPSPLFLPKSRGRPVLPTGRSRWRVDQMSS